MLICGSVTSFRDIVNMNFQVQSGLFDLIGYTYIISSA